MRHRREDITLLKDINRNLDKKNYNRVANQYAGEKVQLISQTSSGISKAGKQKEFFEDKTKSRNSDNSVSLSDTTDSFDDLDSSNRKYENKKSEKFEREEKRNYNQPLVQKCEQLYGKHYPADEVIILILNFPSDTF